MALAHRWPYLAVPFGRIWDGLEPFPDECLELVLWVSRLRPQPITFELPWVKKQKQSE